MNDTPLTRLIFGVPIGKSMIVKIAPEKVQSLRTLCSAYNTGAGKIIGARCTVEIERNGKVTLVKTSTL